MPPSRSHPDRLVVAAAVLVVGAVALTAASTYRPRRLDAWAAPGPPPSSAAQIAEGDIEAVSRAVAGSPSVPPADVGPVARASSSWTSITSAATTIPAAAVQAYADATLTLAEEAPACRLGWTTLAAIGAIESAHGSYGGSVLQADGHVEPAIVGPALDGREFAAVRATADSTALHGDPVWDHAVGPMQFIPSTWQRWRADGDGDGRVDPQDIDDAALAAGRYLCAGGVDLSQAAGWQSAVLSYNHSQEYAAQVLGLANAYGLAARGATDVPAATAAP